MMFIFIIMVIKMIKIFYYELKKIISIQFLIVIFMLLFLDGANIYTNYNLKADTHYEKGYSEVYIKVKGKITNEKITFIKDNRDLYIDLINSNTETAISAKYTGYIHGNMSLFQDFYDQLSYCALYNEKMENTVNILLENKKMTNNTDIIKVSEELINRYDSRIINHFYNTESINNYINYDFSIFISLTITLIFMFQIFFKDYKNEFEKMILPTKIGNKILKEGKLKMLYVLTFLIQICISFYELFLFSLVSHIDGMGNVLYSIESFQNTFSSISILEFIIIQIIMRSLFYILLINLFYILQKFIKNKYIYCFFIILIVILISTTQISNIFILYFLIPRTYFYTGKLYVILGYVIDGFLIYLFFVILFIFIFERIVSYSHKVRRRQYDNRRNKTYIS